MALNGGSLDAAMLAQGNGNFAVLVIDEEDGDTGHREANAEIITALVNSNKPAPTTDQEKNAVYHRGVTFHQARTLRVAAALGWPVYMCVFRMGQASAKGVDREHWSLTLRAYVSPGNSVLFTKPTANAFDQTGLAKMLTDRNVNSLIVLGYQMNACCRSSVFGGVHPFSDSSGAIKHGFNVWSSRSILRMENPTQSMMPLVEELWKNTKGAMLYDK